MSASRFSPASAGESIARMNSQTAPRSAASPRPAVAELALHPFCPACLGGGSASGVKHKGAPGRAVSCAMPQSGSGSASTRSSLASARTARGGTVSPTGGCEPVSPLGASEHPGLPEVLRSLRCAPTPSVPQAAITRSSARCLSETSSNERCTWLVRAV
jgi:hypothetical protein